jgi:hypothetical protein
MVGVVSVHVNFPGIRKNYNFCLRTFRNPGAANVTVAESFFETDAVGLVDVKLMGSPDPPSKSGEVMSSGHWGTSRGDAHQS